MSLRRAIFYTGGRVVTALLAGFGFAFDYTGASILKLSANNWGLIGLIAFGVFILLTFIKEVDLALQQRPKIIVKPVVYYDQLAKLEIHNSGGQANFTAKARVIKGIGKPELYNMRWESFPDSPGCPINHAGDESIIVAETAQNKFVQSDNVLHLIYRNGIVLHEMGTENKFGASSIEIIQEHELKERYPTMYTNKQLPKDECVLEVTLSSEPPSRKDYGLRYYSITIDHENGHKLYFTQLSESEIDKVGSQT